LGEIPANFLLAPYVPQLEVLQRASVFVTHGGMNSTMESLYYGVPMVLVPQQIEQEKTAQRSAELGLGIALDPYNLTAEALRTAVEQVQQAPSFRANVQAMQQTVRAAGGFQSAVDAITGFARTLKQASEPVQGGA
jgi:MGT family glycosyltransferase